MTSFQARIKLRGNKTRMQFIDRAILMLAGNRILQEGSSLMKFRSDKIKLERENRMLQKLVDNE